MRANDFILLLKKIAPSKEVYFSNNHKKMPIFLTKMYFLKSKNNLLIEGDPIRELVSNYNLMPIILGDFQFSQDIEVSDNLNIFCESSHSILAYKTPSDYIIEVDKEESSILNYCAKDSKSFLESLLIICEMYALRFQGIVEVYDNEANLSFFNRCVEKAGGEYFGNFYKQIIFPGSVFPS